MLDKAIAYGKEKRKQYRNSKRFDTSCRNNGGCPYCEQNRLYSYNRDKFAADEQIKFYYGETNGNLPRSKSL